MKGFTRAGVMFLLVSLFPLPAIAHDGWIEVSTPIVEKGQAVTISLMQGNHSNEHKSYRLAGKWDIKFTKLAVLDPAGKETDLTNRLIDFGEDEEKIGPKGPKGFHLAQFTAGKEGVYVVLARQERILQFRDGPKFRSVRIARAVFAALPVPTVASANKLRGVDRSLGEENALEIVPVTNPLGVMQKDSVTLELRYKGKPAPGKVVTVLRKIDGPASAQDQTTDSDGRITLAVDSPDLYLVRAMVEDKDGRSEGQYELSSYEATYDFQVFNRP